SPCFATVGDQFFAASTIELGRELVALLQKPGMNDPAKGSPATNRQEFLAGGGVALLKAVEDQLMTQVVLDRGVPIDQARKAVYGDTEFRFDARLQTGK